MSVVRTAVSCFLVAVAWANGGGLVLRAPAKVARVSNPFEGNERALRAGAKLYARECAACHGSNREGGEKAPSLNRPESSSRRRGRSSGYCATAHFTAACRPLRTCLSQSAGRSSLSCAEWPAAIPRGIEAADPNSPCLEMYAPPGAGAAQYVHPVVD